MHKMWKVAMVAIGTQRSLQSNRQHRRARERTSQECFKDNSVVVCALEIVVNRTEDGTLWRTMATLQSLRHWQDIHVVAFNWKSICTYRFYGWALLIHDSALGSHWYNTILNRKNKRIFDDAVLMVVTASIYGHLVRALTDTSDTRCLVPSIVVLPLVLTTVKD